MKENKTKRFLSLIMSIVMCFSLCFVNVFTVNAEGNIYGDFTVTGNNLSGCSYDRNVLTISKGGKYLITMAKYGGSTNTDRIKVTAADSEVIITLNGINITSSSASPFEVNSSSDVTIKLNGENVLDASSAYNYAGLQKTSTNNLLTITSADGDGKTSGSLTATGYFAAGIGGVREGNGSYITINGGIVNATSNWGAGIGGGLYDSSSYITISGGNVSEASTEGAEMGGG